MKRHVAAAALGGLLALALPAAPATACTPVRPTIDVSRTRVAPGDAVRVSGETSIEIDVNGCDFIPGPPPEPSATPEPTPSESPTPIVTLPPLRRVAYDSAPRDGVTVTIARAGGTAKRGIGTLPVDTSTPITSRGPEFRVGFAGTVRVPTDLAPGPYTLEASGPTVELGAPGKKPTTVYLYFGTRDVTVVDPLAASGAPDATTRLAVLLLLTAAGALVLNRRLARR